MSINKTFLRILSHVWEVLVLKRFSITDMSTITKEECALFGFKRWKEAEMTWPDPSDWTWTVGRRVEENEGQKWTLLNVTFIPANISAIFFPENSVDKSEFKGKWELLMQISFHMWS